MVPWIASAGRLRPEPPESAFGMTDAVRLGEKYWSFQYAHASGCDRSLKARMPTLASSRMKMIAEPDSRHLGACTRGGVLGARGGGGLHGPVGRLWSRSSTGMTVLSRQSQPRLRSYLQALPWRREGRVSSQMRGRGACAPR